MLEDTHGHAAVIRAESAEGTHVPYTAESDIRNVSLTQLCMESAWHKAYTYCYTVLHTNHLTDIQGKAVGCCATDGS